MTIDEITEEKYTTSKEKLIYITVIVCALIISYFSIFVLPNLLNTG